MATDGSIEFDDFLENWDEWQAAERQRVAQQAVQLVAGDFVHQLRGRGQHHLVDELIDLCSEHGFKVHI